MQYENLTKDELLAEITRLKEELDKKTDQINNIELASHQYEFVCLHAPDGKYLYISPSCKEVTGYEVEEMIGKNPYDFFHYDDKERIRTESHEKALAGENPVVVSYRFIKKDGQVVWFETYTKLILDESGTVEKLVTSSRNISARVEAEISLKESEERFRQLAENINDVIFLRTPEKMLYVNPYFEKIWEKPVETLYDNPQSFLDIIHPNDRKHIESILYSEEYRNKGIFNEEYRILNSKKEIRWLWVRTAPVFKDGKVSRIVGIVRDITDKKEYEASLLKTTSILEETQKMAKIGTIEFQTDSKSTYWSDEIYELFELDPLEQDPSLNYFLDIIHPDDRESVYMSIRELFVKNYFSIIFRIILNNSKTKYIKCIGRYESNSSTKMDKQLLILQDISDFKKVEISLLEHSELLDQAQKLAKLGHWYWNIQKNEIEWSDQVFIIFGYEPFSVEVDFDLYSSRIHPEDRDYVISSINNSVFKKEGYLIEHRILLPDNRVKYVLATSKINLDINGEAENMIGIVQDITEMKENQIAFENSLSFTKQMLKYINEGIVVFDANNIVESCSEQFLRMWDLAGEDLSEINDRIFFRILSDKVINSDEFYEQQILLMEMPDAEMIDTVFLKNDKVLEMLSRPRVFKDTISGKILIFREITSWVRAKDELLWYNKDLEAAKNELEKQREILEDTINELEIAKKTAEEATKAKSFFLANMSHEIRTPMNAILGFADLLHSEINDPKQKKYLDAVSSSGKNLLTLINEILDLSKIEAGKFDLEYVVMDMKTLASEMHSIFQLKAEEKKIDLIVSIDNEFPDAIVLDETRMRQILLNLISNAVKFTDEGFVKLSLLVDRIDYVNNTVDITIEVEDTGIGIPENQKNKIFEAFVQMEGQSTRKYGGTGLGLTITKRLINLMNGNLNLISRIGKGSVFSVSFKNIEISSRDKNKDYYEKDSYDDIVFKNMKILIADDVEINRELIKSFLEKSDVKFLEAENGIQALELCKTELPDIVLIDMKMPVVDGYTASKQIKADPELKHIPLIAVTASVMPDSLKKVMEVCDSVLKKPVLSKDLFKELLKYVGAEKREPMKTIAEDDKSNDFIALQWGKIDDKTARYILERLNSEFIEDCNNLKDSLIIDDAESYGKKLMQLGEETSMNSLVQYGSMIVDDARNFDIDSLEKNLDLFDKIIQNIENSALK